MDSLKPKKRHKIRIVLGMISYRALRYAYWFFGGTRFAKKSDAALYPNIIFQHKTPILRKLKDVDMWLQYNKAENLRIAVKCIDRAVIMPGETFSYWKLIGKPTKIKGYKEGVVLYNGSLRPGIGGGLCQLSNLIYWMTLHTPLTVIERFRHSFDVFPDSNRTQPFGSGATCVYNYRDLQIRNCADMPYQLHVYISDGYLCGEWRAVEPPEHSYEVYEKKHWITHEHWGGYVRHNILQRRVLCGDSSILKDEYICENHAIMMYQPFLAEGSQPNDSGSLLP